MPAFNSWTGVNSPTLDARYVKVADVVDGVQPVALWLPGVSGNYVSTPDSAALSPSSALELVVRCALVDWTSGSTQVLMAKAASSGQRAFQWVVTSTGTLQLLTSADGTNWVQSGGRDPSNTDGTSYWLKVTWRASDGLIQMFKADDSAGEPTSWTQVGADTVGATSDLLDSTSAVEVASTSVGTAALAAGVFRRAIMRTTIGGPIVADWRADAPASRYRDQLGNLWAVNGTGGAWVFPT
jgi:hypothetical protein